jgi:hypothetical protein
MYDDLAAKGITRAKLFSWKRAAEQPFAAYQTAMAEK